jgi:hypothetical protein
MSDPTDKALETARKAQRTVNAYHRTFNSEHGKAVLDDLEKVFGTNKPAFLPGSDALQAAIRDGQRQVKLHIDAKLVVPAAGDADIEKPTTQVIK